MGCSRWESCRALRRPKGHQVSDRRVNSDTCGWGCGQRLSFNHSAQSEASWSAPLPSGRQQSSTVQSSIWYVSSSWPSVLSRLDCLLLLSLDFQCSESWVAGMGVRKWCLSLITLESILGYLAKWGREERHDCNMILSLLAAPVYLGTSTRPMASLKPRVHHDWLGPSAGFSQRWLNSRNDASKVGGF